VNPTDSQEPETFLAVLTAWPGRFLVGLTVVLIRIYQWTLSPLLGQACRFEPSCSRYMEASLRKHGPIRGFARGVRRLLKCHPWNPGGYDPP
jgi:putative membrane protein insertion efficiency factor